MIPAGPGGVADMVTEQSIEYRARHLRVSPLRRALCIPLGVLTSSAGLGPFVDGGSFTSPLFDVFRQIAPLTWWGVVWIVATVFVVAASVTGRWFSYVIAHIIVAFMSTFWFLVLVRARFVVGFAVSPTAFGLWAFPAGYATAALIVKIATVPYAPQVAQVTK